MSVIQQAILATFAEVVPFVTIYTMTPTNTTGGNYSNDTLVHKFGNSLLANHSSYRITVLNGTDAGTLNKMYLGQAATTEDAWDFAASPAPVPVTWGGSGNLVMAVGTEYVSDSIDFAGTGGVLVISTEIDIGLNMTRFAENLGAGVVTYKRADVAQADIVDKSLYTTSGTQRGVLITKIEAK